EMGRAVNTDRRFTSAAPTAGALVAREPYLGKRKSGAKTNLDNMMLSIKHSMQPYDTSSLKLGVMSVRASTTDAADTKVVWSYSYNGKSVPAGCSAYSLPVGLVGESES